MRAHVCTGYVALVIAYQFVLVAAFLLRAPVRIAERRSCLPRLLQGCGGGSHTSLSSSPIRYRIAHIGAAEAVERIFSADPEASPRSKALPLNVVEEFFAIKRENKGPQLKQSLSRAQVEWAEWEIRRFGYKLGTANRQLRQLAEKHKALRNSFTSSKEELDKVRQAKHEVSVKLRIASRLRRLFITYKNGLLANVQPRVPYVPLKYRSENVPADFYSLGTRKHNNVKKFAKLKQHKEVEGKDQIRPASQSTELTDRQGAELSPSVGGRKGINNVRSYLHRKLVADDADQRSTESVSPHWEADDAVPSLHNPGDESPDRVGDTEDFTSHPNFDLLTQKSGERPALGDSRQQKVRSSGGVSKDKAQVEREILGLIAEAKNQAPKYRLDTGKIPDRTDGCPRDCKMYPGYNVKNTGRSSPGSDGVSASSGSSSERLPSVYGVNYGVQQRPFAASPYGGWQAQMQTMGAQVVNYNTPADINAAHMGDQSAASMSQRQSQLSQMGVPGMHGSQLVTPYAVSNVVHLPASAVAAGHVVLMGYGGHPMQTYPVGVGDAYSQLTQFDPQNAAMRFGDTSMEGDAAYSNMPLGTQYPQDEASLGLEQMLPNASMESMSQPESPSAAASTSPPNAASQPIQLQEDMNPLPCHQGDVPQESIFEYPSPELDPAKHLRKIRVKRHVSSEGNDSSMSVPFPNVKAEGGKFWEVRVNIEEEFRRLLPQMPQNSDELIAMARPHIEIEVSFFSELGGIYQEYEDETAIINENLDTLRKQLNELHLLMGRTVPSKLTEPIKIHDLSIWEPVLKEMNDFQDLVDYEHREKRRKFKALSAAAQKQASRFENRKLALEQEEIKQRKQHCKNVANAMAIYWKKIERFAWERMKRDLQATLIEKKRMRLDKFVEDAIKLSITKNDKVKGDGKTKRESQESKRHHTEDEVKDEPYLSAEMEAHSQPETIDVKKESVKKERHGSGSAATGDDSTRDDEAAKGVADDEFVISEEMKRMERDDALLDMAMEKEEQLDQEAGNQKKELNALEDDLNVPIEEILRRYKEEEEKFKEEHNVSSHSDADDETEVTSEHSDTERHSADGNDAGDEMDVDDEDGTEDETEAEDEGDTEVVPPPSLAATRSKRRRPEATLASSDAVKDEATDDNKAGTQEGGKDDMEAEFTLGDDKFKEQEDEDVHLDEAISDEHSDNEAGKQERVKEISALEEDANLPIEELIARYRAAGGYGESDDMSMDDSASQAASDTDSDDTKMHDASKGDELTDEPECDDSTAESSTDEDAVQVPSLIRATLRPYQIDGLRWLASLYRKGSNGILADEMGLGKTLQTIALLAHLACDHGNWGPHLIVVPTSVLLNWEMEFKKFCPGFMILSYYGSPAERAKKRIGWNKEHAFNVCIASYATVVQDSYILKRKSWVYMVLDEAQNIKNFHSKRWQTLLTFNTQGRILLTGTPLQNSLQELWSLMHFILPDVFTSHSEFKEWFSDPLTESIEREQMNGEGNKQDLQTSHLVKKLHTVLRPYLLRRLKKDVEKQMPSKYEHVIKCYLSRRQRVLYDEFISSRSAVEALKNPNYRSMLFVLMQLRKICNHPDQLQSRPVETPYYDPIMMENVMFPSMFLLPESRPGARLYRHEVINMRPYPSETLPIMVGSRDHQDRVVLPLSFVKSFRGSKVPFQRVFRQNKNVYDKDVAQLPVVSRFPISKCLLSRKSGGRRKLTLSGFLIESMLSANPFDDVSRRNRGYLLTGHAPAERAQGLGPTVSIAASSVCSEYDAAAGNFGYSGRFRHAVNKTVSMGLESGRSVSTSSPANAVKQDFDPFVNTRAAPYHAGPVVRNVNFYPQMSEISDVSDSATDSNIVVCTTDDAVNDADPTGKGESNDFADQTDEANVVVNRRELLEVNDNFLLQKFTIDRRPKPKAECFQKIVAPTVDDVVERNWWMLSRFVCTTGKVVECNPRRVVVFGPGGVTWNSRQEATADRIHSKLQRPSSFAYFKETKCSIEHARGLQKVLFPPRSLLHDDCGKFLVLGRLLKKLKSEGHRCLLYTQFSKMLDILENWINFMGFTYVRLDGSTKVDMRQRIVTRFNENEKIFLFISSTRAGGVGLTLTGADTVIFYDTDWNPAMDRQAMDRCHRIGQTREVNVYRLISEHTVEENIWRKQLQKRRLDDIVVDKGNFDSEHHNWFSNVDTLMTILKQQTAEGRENAAEDDDIYGKKVLHESQAPELDDAVGGDGPPPRVVNMLAEAEDEDDVNALKNRSKEARTANKDFQDFSGDMISTMPALVAYSIQLLLTYLTPTLVAQRDEMKVKIKVESMDSAVEEDSESSASEVGYGSDPESSE
ncbi:DEAD-box family helicase [Babesia ovata]|uniref:DEAD-box family helicase n=1 Tax=Babesia ovata TaxID=189622 RepID=A0A2H6KAW8_9APIC|nr:DEAD-box family helicase [Babesia ovata]GBE60141.1 DEAD-box family helicase [Babesia ovata]